MYTRKIIKSPLILSKIECFTGARSTYFFSLFNVLFFLVILNEFANNVSFP